MSLLSCSSEDDSVLNTNSVQVENLTKWKIENYTYYNQQISNWGNIPLLLNSTEYNISNGKISSYIKTVYNSNQTNDIYITTLSYSNDIVSYRETKKNNVIVEKETFTFNPNNLVSEYLQETIDLNSNSQFYKYVYNYSLDLLTIQIDMFSSSDGINFQLVTNDYVKVFNLNNDMVSSQFSTSINEYFYDTNGNITQIFENNFTYDNKVNHSSNLLFNSYGKKNYWLYKIGWSIYDPIELSKNTITQINKTGSIRLAENQFSSNDILLNNKFVYYFFDNYPDYEIRNSYTFE